MDIHDYFLDAHQTLRRQAQEVERALHGNTADVPDVFGTFLKQAQAHLRSKELYYQQLDKDKRVTDRVLMHDLRNNHAALVFTLESLEIRMKKHGPTPEWQAKWKSLIEVMNPHFSQEEKTLFPLGEKLLTPEERQALGEKLS